MIEVEVRARLPGPGGVMEKLKRMNAEFKGTLEQNDYVYAFESPGERVKEGGVVARIREENGKAFLEFKEIRREGAGFDMRTEIKDTDTAKRLLGKLGLNYLCVIRKKRELFQLDGFVIAVDNVDGLGDFIEVEKTLDSGSRSEEAREACIRLLERIAGNIQIENKKYGDLLLEKGK